MDDKTNGLTPIGPLLGDLIASGNLPAVSGERERKLSLAVQRADLLFRCYPKSEADDPETYAAAASALLAKYPDDVILQATDPADGIAAHCKWRPHLAEIREFCEQIMIPRRIAEDREAELERTRRLMEERGPPRDQRPTYADLKSKIESEHGPNWGIGQGDDFRKKSPWLSLDQLAHQAGVPLEQALALPDLPPEKLEGRG